MLTGPFWTLKDGTIIQLITPDILKHLPRGTVLRSIMGERVTVGVDYIDNDTRGGYLAYGVED